MNSSRSTRASQDTQFGWTPTAQPHLSRRILPNSGRQVKLIMLIKDIGETLPTQVAAGSETVMAATFKYPFFWKKRCIYNGLVGSDHSYPEVYRAIVAAPCGDSRQRSGSSEDEGLRRKRLGLPFRLGLRKRRF